MSAFHVVLIAVLPNFWSPLPASVRERNKKMMQYFSKSSIARFAFGMAACVLIILISCWLAPLLPVTTGWENGPIENSQVVILLGGFFCAAIFYFRQSEARLKALWLCIMPVWLILAMRELSWGAVFYPPLEFFGYTGPVFSSRIQLWYKPFVTPVVLILLGLSLFHFLRTRQYRTLSALFRARSVPVTEFLVVVILMIASAASEGHMGSAVKMRMNLHMGAPQVFEESVELFAYLTLVLAQFRVLRGLATRD